jgi:cytochrome c
MDTWEKLKIGIAVTGTVVVMVAIHSATDLLFPDTYVSKPGYKIAGVEQPAVDLASLQRTWPAGLRREGGASNVRDYMTNIEKVSIPRSAGATAAVAAPAPQVDLGTALAAADVDKGRQTAQVCTACHTFVQGGPDVTGPNLWGVVGRDVASHGGFAYSPAMIAQPGAWNYERLDQYLANPAKAVPGNKMGFAGLRRTQDRANVLAFLATFGAGPVPLPRPEPQRAEAAPPPLG